MHKLLFLLTLLFSHTAYAGEENAEDYVIGAGDTVSISVYKSADLKLEARVSEAGTVNFPLIGEVKLDGLTTRQAEISVSKELTTKNFLVSPQVNVSVIDYQSKMFSILGNILTPGKYPIKRPIHLTEAIALAKGTTALASDVVSIISIKDGVTQKRFYDLKSIMGDKSDSFENPLIQKNDTIYIPNYPVFYIYGEVKTPGAYKIDKNMRVSQALALGGGLTPRGTKKNITIDRSNASGSVVKIPANLNDLVQPDDIIDIKESLF